MIEKSLIRKCPQCFIKFASYNKEKIYCSKECLNKTSPSKLEGKQNKFTCKRCHNIFYTYRSRAAYCCMECYYEKPEVEVKNCVVCQKEMNPLQRGIFCGVECRTIDRRSKSKVKDHVNNFVNKKERKKVSIAELIRQNEYNRLYDNFHINRLIRGKGTKQN